VGLENDVGGRLLDEENESEILAAALEEEASRGVDGSGATIERIFARETESVGVCGSPVGSSSVGFGNEAETEDRFLRFSFSFRVG